MMEGFYPGVVGRVSFGTESVGDESARTYGERLKRCYELAGYAVLLGGVPVGSVLVHGTIDGGPGTLGRIGHAWVLLPDGKVWEPITREIWRDYATWQSYADAKVERQYSKQRVSNAVRFYQHWGVWHKSQYR